MASERSPLLAAQQPQPYYVDDDLAKPPVESESESESSSVDEERAAQFDGNEAVSKQLKFIVPAVAIGIYLASADQTIIVSSYGRIGSDLEALNLTSWIATSYLLSLTSFQPLYGKLSDIFGRKGCLLFSYVMFGLGGLACGLAGTMEQLIAARVFQGVGGGGITTVTSILFNDLVPLKDRGLWAGIINIIYAIGSASGAPLGGICSDSIGWRWTFLAQAPIAAIALVVVAIVLKIPPRPTDATVMQKTWLQKLKRVDFLGALVLVTATFSLIFGMDRGSNISWKIAESYVPLILSAVLFVVFVVVELKVASEPFAPGHVIFRPSMFASYLCYFFSHGAWTAAMYYMPLYFQAVDGTSATQSGVRLLPSVAGSVGGSLVAGFSIKKTGKYRTLTIIAYTLLTAGMLPIILFSGVIRVHHSLVGVLLGMGVCAFGNAIGFTSALIALIADASPQDAAIATACSYLFRSLGSTIGVALSGTVVQQVLRDTLKEELGSGHEAEEIERNVRQSLDYLKYLTPDIKDIVEHCYGVAVRHSYVLILGLASGALLSSFFVRENKLSR